MLVYNYGVISAFQKNIWQSIAKAYSHSNKYINEWVSSIYGYLKLSDVLGNVHGSLQWQLFLHLFTHL